jgi:hypothetical protein
VRLINEQSKLAYSYINPSFVECLGEIWEAEGIFHFAVSMFSGGRLIAQSADKAELENYRNKIIDKLHMDLS